MLLESGDLIPVRREAIEIPWTRRKSQILNFLLRGPVDFTTYVFDTNVGDIAPLSTYFNPYHWTVQDLNHKFGIRAAQTSVRETSMKTLPSVGNEGEDMKSRSLMPKLMIYPLKEGSDQQDGESHDLSIGRSFPCQLSKGPELLTLPMDPSKGWRPGSIFRPRAVRAYSVPNQKQPLSPDSPDKNWLPAPWEESDCVFRPNSVSPTGSLEPIGPPKRRKLTTSPSWESNWPTRESCFKLEDETRHSHNPTYFSILTEKDSPWSPWPMTAGGKLPVFDLNDGDRKGQQDDGLVSSLRKLAQQNNGIFA